VQLVAGPTSVAPAGGARRSDVDNTADALLAHTENARILLQEMSDYGIDGSPLLDRMQPSLLEQIVLDGDGHVSRSLPPVLHVISVARARNRTATSQDRPSLVVSHHPPGPSMGLPSRRSKLV